MEPKGNKYKINVTNHSKQGDHVEYLIRITSSDEPNLSIEFLERYSNLKSLHDKLRSEHTSSSLFPNFPPKKFFGSTDSKFLIQRQSDLNSYFNEIYKSTVLYNLPSYQKWIEFILKKYLNTAPKDKGNKIKQKEIQEKPLTPEALKKIVDEYSKQFHDFFSNQINEKEEDDIEKNYEQIINENSVFKRKIIEESLLFSVVPGRDNNLMIFEHDNELLIETETKLKNKLDTIDQIDLSKLYFVDTLIIPFKV